MHWKDSEGVISLDSTRCLLPTVDRRLWSFVQIPDARQPARFRNGAVTGDSKPNRLKQAARHHHGPHLENQGSHPRQRLRRLTRSSVLILLLIPTVAANGICRPAGH